MNFSGWKEFKLSDICQIKYGKDHKNLNEGKIPTYGSGGVMRYVDSFIYDKPSVLIPRKGSLSNLYFVNEKFWTVDTLFWTIIDETIASPKFLYFQLLTKNLSDMNVGSAVPSLTTAVLNELRLQLPSLETQYAISGILSSLNDKIELNNKINKTLEEMAQAIFKSWFVDFEPFRDGEFIESEHGFIPKGWKVTNFSQYYDYVAGYSYSGDELVSSKTALLTIKNFDRNGGLRNDGFKEINPIKKVKEEKYAKLFDVVVACTDLTQKAEIIGNPLLVTSSAEYESMIFSMDLVKILPTTEMADSCFAYQILKDQRFKGFALKYVSGTTVLHLSKKAFNEYLLPLPYDFQIIQKYVEIVRPMFEKLVEIESENNRLIKVRDSLLPKLMSGEIRVPFEGVPNAELR